MPVPRFTAAYESDCATCSGPIDEGDETGYVDDEVVCADCLDAVDDSLAFP